jgi:hypothetical protein
MLEEVELGEMEQVADIGDEAVPREVADEAIGGRVEIGRRRVEAEIVVDQPGDLEPPGRRPADRDDDVGVAPGDRLNTAGGGDELDDEPRIAGLQPAIRGARK